MAGAQVVDSGEKRLNELGYKQELRREMTLFKTLAISFSTMTLFTGITPLYGSSLQYAGPASLVWGWVVVSFFTWFVGIAMAEICSSFPVSTPTPSRNFPACRRSQIQGLWCSVYALLVEFSWVWSVKIILSAQNSCNLVLTLEWHCAAMAES
uniref:Amino-acid permease n=2 Tax=Aegilops tauschii subsp. strangulata TaxID=200361 RepID=A0A453C0P3_AEGTS